jgi:hypothetical protein
VGAISNCPFSGYESLTSILFGIRLSVRRGGVSLAKWVPIAVLEYAGGRAVQQCDHTVPSEIESQWYFRAKHFNVLVNGSGGWLPKQDQSPDCQLRSAPCLGSLGTLLATNLLDIESRLLREQTRNLFARSAIQADESIYIFSPSRPTASRIPWRRACGRGGHPGMYTSTGTTLSTPPREA